MKRSWFSVFALFLVLLFASCSARFGHGLDESTFKADSPIISPQTGSFPAGTLITMSTATEDATIKYTTDGSDPSATNGTIYTQPVELSSSTIKAIALKDKMDNSDVSSGSYSVQAPYSPIFSVAGSTYNNPQIVALSVPQGDYDQIKYTTDGSDPNNGTVYTAPITVNATGTTIKAVTVNAGVTSSESSATYILKAANPTVSHTNCPSIQMNCPANPIVLPQNNQSSIKVSLINDLYATNITPPPPTPMAINCTKCVYLASATTGAAFEWRYVYTPPAGQSEPAPVYSSWVPYCQKIACSAISLPQGVTGFTIEARAKKTNMVDSGTVSTLFYK